MPRACLTPAHKLSMNITLQKHAVEKRAFYIKANPIGPITSLYAREYCSALLNTPAYSSVKIHILQCVAATIERQLETTFQLTG